MTTLNNPRVHQGDEGDTAAFTLTGISTLNGATSVRALVQRKETIAILDATVTDAPGREVTVEWGTTGGWLPSRPKVGRWDLQIEVTFVDGRILTWPNTGDGTAFVEVLDEIEPA